MREHNGARPELIRHTQPRHADVVLVDWTLGNSCNFACSYCPEALHDGSIRWQKPDAVIAFYDQLHRHYVVGMGRTVWLQFTGGEPTVYPGLMDILGAARARGFKVSLISNGSRTRRFWERLVERLDAAILTYHDEFVDHRAFLDIAGLVSAQLPLNINVTAHPDRFEAIVARAAELRASAPNAWVTLKPLRRGFGSELYDYTPAQIEQMARWDPGGRPGPGTSPRGTMTVVMPDGTEFKRRANQFLIEGSNRWRGYSCAAGLESLRVTGAGKVHRAVCGSGGTLGHLGQTFELPAAAIRCDRDSCGCVADILITKRRTPEPPPALNASGADRPL